MSRLLKKIIPAGIAFLLLLSLPVAAAETGKAYTYNYRQQSVIIPDPYVVDEVIGNSGLKFKSPEDLMAYGDELYVLDSGNHRVVVLNSELDFVREIRFTRNGKPYETQELKGFCVDDRGIFVADRSGQKVFFSDYSGKVIKEFFKPETPLLPENNMFLPLKVLTDSTGQLYILVENEYRGAISISNKGEFEGFFGSSNVKVTAALLLDELWRSFMTEEQRSGTQRYLPMEYKNFTRDNKDFIYAVQGTTSGTDEPLRKLNSQGINVLTGRGPFGDPNLGKYKGKLYNSNFISITVDEDEFISILDNTWNRIFQYNREGELLFVFGGKGDQKGTFSDPVDLEAFQGRILVLDRYFGNITVFEPTEYGRNIRLGYQLYQEGRFQASVEPWKKVLEIDGSCEMAYNSIGKALLMEKKYKQAMEYFRIANSKAEYSLAFQRYRKFFLRNNFTWFVFLASIVVIAVLIIRYFWKRNKTEIILDNTGKIKYLFYTMIHPADGFGEIRYNHMYSYRIGIVLMGLYFLFNVMKYFLDGFIFNNNDPHSFNLMIALFTTLGLPLVFTVINWLLSSFFDGKGKLGDVFIVISYAMVPLILSNIATLVLTNVLIMEEGVFIKYVSAVGTIWAGIMAFSGLAETHMYTFKRNVVSVAASGVGVCVILFLVFLLFNLYTEFARFLEVVIKEILYRSRAGF